MNHLSDNQVHDLRTLVAQIKAGQADVDNLLAQIEKVVRAHRILALNEAALEIRKAQDLCLVGMKMRTDLVICFLDAIRGRTQRRS